MVMQQLLFMQICLQSSHGVIVAPNIAERFLAHAGIKICIFKIR